MNGGTLAAIAVKSFAQGKLRLAEYLEPAWRRRLMEAMFRDVLAAVARVRGLETVLVVTADPIATRTAQEAGAGVGVLRDEERGHNHAARHAIAEAARRGARRLLLLPGDCPLLAPADLEDLLALAPAQPSVVVVPDRHGSGTNALLLAPPDALVPAFGPGSRERHLGAARSCGVSADVIELPSLALDLDTPADLALLADDLHRAPERAPHTARVLGELAASRN